ncbi:unnamed protein product [Symbiodinium natans]|uniref:Uncharacterized protein n=1 Tax=Symbiodinium natans TaxID=878477 RepID=A0A812UTH9_9DINO|nr:unnamed protein product [Symbiodinium natans]
MGVGKAGKADQADPSDLNGSKQDEAEQAVVEEAAAGEAAAEEAAAAPETNDVQALPVAAPDPLKDGADAGQKEVPATEDEVDDIVPFICYDEEKGSFSKDDRWILPKRNQFPLIFCALRVRIRLEPFEPSNTSTNPWNLSAEEVEALLRKSLGLEDLLVRFDDCRDRIDAAINARELVAALKADLPAGLGVGDVKEVAEHQMLATFVHVLETSDDMDSERISSLAARLKEGGSCDSITLELPQIWIISDPDFRAKTASIGLYPGSFWMGFLKSWGAVKIAEVFFRKVDPEALKHREPTVTVAVQFRERENLKTCFTFLYDRYLVHPKQKNALRQPWCKLVDFEEFKAKTLGRPVPSRPKAAAPAAGKLKINQPTMQQAPPKPKATAKAEAKAASADDFDRQLTPAEAMQGLSGRQLEAFQMVMSRMERLERENQELMQLLIQMQGLLQQHQQRNAQLVGLARPDPVNPLTSNAARVAALHAHRQLMATQPCAVAAASVPLPRPPAAQTPLTPPPAAAVLSTLGDPQKRKAPGDDAEADGDDAEAPWKRQRRRQRRGADDKSAADVPPGELDELAAVEPDAAAAGAAAPEANGGEAAESSTGLAAYHDALLGM